MLPCIFYRLRRTQSASATVAPRDRKLTVRLDILYDHRRNAIYAIPEVCHVHRAAQYQEQVEGHLIGAPMHVG